MNLDVAGVMAFVKERLGKEVNAFFFVKERLACDIGKLVGLNWFWINIDGRSFDVF